MNDKKNDDVIKYYTKAIRLNSRYADAYVFRGVVYMKQQRYDSAIEDFTKLIHLNPKSAYAYLIRGLAHDQKQEYENALKDYTKSIELDPSLVGTYRSRGMVYIKKQRYNSAIEDFKNAIKLEPKSVETYRGLTYAYSQQQNIVKKIINADRGKLYIFTEGYNTDYIQKAISFFDTSLLSKIDIEREAPNRRGKDQLKTIFDTMSTVKFSKKFLFIWDSDVEKIPNSIGNYYTYKFNINDENRKVETGIENLFPENRFTNDLYIVEKRKDGGNIELLQKNIFRQRMISEGTKEDFVKFEPLVQEIQRIINNQN